LAVCAGLLDEPPHSAWAIGDEASSFVTLVLEFGGQRRAQISLWTATAGRTPGRFEVVAESGTATAELPRQLRWRNADGQMAQRLPIRSAEERGLEGFLLALRSGQPMRPSFEEAYQALTWLRAAVRSRDEGRRIACGDPSP
jgi:predicted dehydrogenase